MIRSIDGSTDLYLARLRQISLRLQKAESEVTGGKRVERPSDDPDVISNLLQVRADRSRLAQVSTNLDRVRAEVDNAEGAMQDAVRMFEQVRTLGLAGTGTEQTSESRTQLAEQLGTILERMVGLSNLQVAGRFVFSGDGDTSPAYGLDLQQNPPWTSYQGSASTRRVAHPSGGTMAIATDAQTIFENAEPSRNVFQSIETLRQALLANDADGIQAALQPLSGVSDHLNAMLAFYGTAQNRLEEASNSASKQQLQLKLEQSGLEDADATEAILELTQLKYTQQAALEVRSKLNQTSLFDYLG